MTVVYCCLSSSVCYHSSRGHELQLGIVAASRLKHDCGVLLLEHAMLVSPAVGVRSSTWVLLLRRD